MLEIVSTEKKITLAFDGLTQSYPLGSLACEYTDNGLSIFTDDKVRIYTAPMSQTTVNGTQLTPDNAADLLDSLFKSGSDGGGSLPIEITDVNGLQAELDTIVTNKILYENEYNALSQAEKDDPSISYFIIEPPLRAFLEQVSLDGGLVENPAALTASYIALTDEQKASDLVLLPGAYKEGYVYAVKSDGTFEKLSFTRGSTGTRFDSNLNMELISTDIPRIDYGNYSASTKLLLEKESRNFAIDNGLELGLGNYPSNGVTTLDHDWEGLLLSNKAWRLDGVPSGPAKAAYKSYPSIAGENITYSLFSTKGNAIPSLFYLNYNSGSDGGFSSNNLIPPSGSPQFAPIILQKNNIARFEVYKTMYTTSSDNVNGIAKSSGSSQDSLFLGGYQIEYNTYASSYIPTTDRTETRLADSLSINLPTDSTVYIKTAKEEKTITKSAGVWNVQDDILESDGIELITVNYN